MQFGEALGFYELDEKQGTDNSVSINFFTLTEEEHEKLNSGGIIDVTPCASDGDDSGGSGRDGTLVTQDGTRS